MIDPKVFLENLSSREINRYFGVPDSLMKGLCCHLESFGNDRHIIAANEGAAMALAIGSYLAIGHPALVYMQNSGLGNAINPLVSLASKAVMGVPAVLLIGWRGEPGVKDEPQHSLQGRATIAMLEAMKIKHWVLEGNWQRELHESITHAVEKEEPVAVLVKKDTFHDAPKVMSNQEQDATLSRREALTEILNNLKEDAIVFSTTGKISRELYELRQERGEKHQDFLCIGGMGHVISVATGAALADSERAIVCIDGDGSFLMHLGSSVLAASYAPSNLIHIVVNNGVHESVGGQVVCKGKMRVASLARAAGYASVLEVTNASHLKIKLEQALSSAGPSLLEVRVSSASSGDLIRPEESPETNKLAVMAAFAAGGSTVNGH